MAISSKKTKQEIIDNAGAGGIPVEIFEEGVSLTPAVVSIDFVGAGVTATETSQDFIQVEIGGLEVQNNGVSLTNAVSKLNFTNFTITQPDPKELDITAPISSSGGHTIQDEGVSLTQRSILDFTGAGVTVSDSGTKTTVNIPGSTSGGGSGGSATVFETTLASDETEIILPVLDYNKAYTILFSGQVTALTNVFLEVNGDTSSSNYKNRYAFESGNTAATANGDPTPGLPLFGSNPDVPTLAKASLWGQQMLAEESVFDSGEMVHVSRCSRYLPTISSYTSLSIKAQSGLIKTGSKILITGI